MTVADLVRQYLKVRTNISDDDLWILIQDVVQANGFDINAIDEAYAELIAEEIDKSANNLSVSASEQSGGLAVAAPSNGKKSKPNLANQGNIDTLKIAVQNLRTAVANESNAMYEMSNTKSTEVEDAAAERIVNRYKQIPSNIVAKVSAGLQEYADESASFRGQIGSIFDEAFADIVNN